MLRSRDRPHLLPGGATSAAAGEGGAAGGAAGAGAAPDGGRRHLDSPQRQPPGR